MPTIPGRAPDHQANGFARNIDGADPEQSAVAGDGAVWAPGILIASGLGLVLVSLKLELESLGFRVWLAQDGEEAVRRYGRHHDGIDLVVLDAQLPGREGLQTLSALRQIDPDVLLCLLTVGRPDRGTNDSPC